MKEAEEDHKSNPVNSGGQDRQQNPGQSPGKMVEDDNLDFVVTEAPSEGHELVGGVQPNSPTDGDLEIESNAHLMESGARSNRERAKEFSRAVTNQPIGETSPPRPKASSGSTVPENKPDLSSPLTNKLEKLSKEKLGEISRRMRGGSTEASDFVTEEEKLELLKKLDSASGSGPKPAPDNRPTGFDNQPIVPPTKSTSRPLTPKELPTSGPPPKVTRRLRRIAYFTRSFIQVTGEQALHEHDEMTINGRDYILRRKKLTGKLLAITGIPLAFIVIAIASALVSMDSGPDTGQIIGMVMGDNHRPHLSGATIRFPELARSITSNAQGFFRADGIRSGAYKIEYIIDGEVIATDFATVVNGKTTMLTLSPEKEQIVAVSSARKPAARKKTAATQRQPERQTVQTSPPPVKQPEVISTKLVEAPSKASADKWAKLTLAANVNNAKLKIDGKVRGAGNLTYTQLKPGKHTYLVTKNGYLPVQGSISLTSGKTKVLRVVLDRVSVPKTSRKTRTQSAFVSGQRSLEKGDYAAVLEQMTTALAQKPDNADAYVGRATAHRKLKNTKAAYEDYLKAADIYHSKKQGRKALTAYDNAIRLNKKSVPAHLGRGKIYLSQGQSIAAVSDFDMVIRQDKRNLDGYIGLGEARFNQGYHKKAAKHFKDARSINSRDPAIHQSLMLCYMAMGNMKQVKKSYEKFLKYASEKQSTSFKKNPKYSAIMKVVEN